MKYLRFLYSPVFMGMLFIVFAVAMAMATFIENDFGSGYAYSRVYGTWWFELILLLLAVNLIGQIFLQKLYKRNKFPIFMFHFSFVIMIAGAAITRYFGWEGILHIREGETADMCYSSQKFIDLEATDAEGKTIVSDTREYSIESGSRYREKISANGKNYEVVLARIIPNAMEVINDSPGGEALISLLVSRDMSSRKSVILKKGELKTVMGMSIGFESSHPADIMIRTDSSSFFILSEKPVSEVSMMTGQSVPAEPGKKITMRPMQLLMVNDVRIVPQQMTFSGTRKIVAVNPEEQTTNHNAFVFHVFSGSQSGTISLWDTQSGEGDKGSTLLDGINFSIAYGPRAEKLPFNIRLNDFILERYPGSSSPSGYRSSVVLQDPARNIEKPFDIYMNNILKYKGYRFYQSSYDPDERGTILSVNKDFAGMMVTYSGYALLFLFIILSLVMKNSFFRKVTAGHWSSAFRRTAALIALMLLISGLDFASAQKLVPGKESSEAFGRVLVQDQKGRTKPMFTLSNDILRKVTRDEKYENLSAMQVFLAIHFDFDHWKDEPLIKISNKDLQKQAGIVGDMAAFTDLVDITGKGTYKLSDLVNRAYAKAPRERTKLDKEAMKVDERVNIVYMIYKGDFFKMFPLRDSTQNWGTAADASVKAAGNDSLYLKNVMNLFADALRNNKPADAKTIVESISGYQKKYSGYELPSAFRINAEILYYKALVFERLFPFYALVGIVMLIALIVMVIRGRKEKSLLVRITGWLLLAGFIVHTAGFLLRWYIAGHSPMSNGYESMIFISWVTLLAGFIFSRKSAFAVSATAVLASMTLMVAHLSFMDPEITNLVPVLKSYWLTLHVSVITGSYGFLGLGAILGLIVMILLILSNDSNRERISDTIDELTVINFKTLTLGLYFLTIGTFLGAVWANESWGRYWGWDPKETWSLITVVVYSFVVHSRSIPGMKDLYTFNLLSLFAFSSVLMTYFGVNYYLSGLHSYASGDPVPVPPFVYVAVIILIGLSAASYMKYRNVRESLKE
jgi:cytochrome c-type biogenesis protein CcsB